MTSSTSTSLNEGGGGTPAIASGYGKGGWHEGRRSMKAGAAPPQSPTGRKQFGARPAALNEGGGGTPAIALRSLTQWVWHCRAQ